MDCLFCEHSPLTYSREAWSHDLSSRLWLATLFITPSVFLFWHVTHSGNRSSKTFKPKKNIPEGSHQYELLKHAEATLGSGNLRMAVMLPEGEDLNEWVAVNSKHQFHPHPIPFLDALSSGSVFFSFACFSVAPHHDSIELSGSWHSL